LSIESKLSISVCKDRVEDLRTCKCVLVHSGGSLREQGRLGLYGVRRYFI
jgi:hypothetical protein